MLASTGLWPDTNNLPFYIHIVICIAQGRKNRQPASQRQIAAVLARSRARNNTLCLHTLLCTDGCVHVCVCKAPMPNTEHQQRWRNVMSCRDTLHFFTHSHTHTPCATCSVGQRAHTVRCASARASAEKNMLHFIIEYNALIHNSSFYSKRSVSTRFERFFETVTTCHNQSWV